MFVRLLLLHSMLDLLLWPRLLHGLLLRLLLLLRRLCLPLLRSVSWLVLLDCLPLRQVGSTKTATFVEPSMEDRQRQPGCAQVRHSSRLWYISNAARLKD